MPTRKKKTFTWHIFSYKTIYSYKTFCLHISLLSILLIFFFFLFLRLCVSLRFFFFFFFGCFDCIRWCFLICFSFYVSIITPSQFHTFIYIRLYVRALCANDSSSKSYVLSIFFLLLLLFLVFSFFFILNRLSIRARCMGWKWFVFLENWQNY